MKLMGNILTRRWGIVATLAMVVVGVYGNILDNGFVWDDSVFIYDWEAIQRPVENLAELLFSLPQKHTNFRPIKNAFYAANYALWGENPMGYHAVAVVMHGVSAWLVWLLGYRLLKDEAASLVAALVFAVHPINTEAVAWVTANMDSLGVVVFLICLYGFVVYRQSQEKKWWWLSVAAAGAAFLTNELTFSVVAVVVLYDLLVGRGKWRLVGKEWAMYGALIVGYFGLKNWLMAEAGGGLSLRRIPIGIIGVVDYWRLLLWPANLTVNHHVWGTINAFYQFDSPYLGTIVWPGLLEKQTLVALAVITGFLVMMWRLRKSLPLGLFLAAALVVSFAPVMQLVPTTTIFAERYAYPASVFYGLLVGAVVGWGGKVLMAKWLNGSMVMWVVVGVMVGGYGYLTIQRNSDWQNHLSLWTQAVAANPTSAMNYDHLSQSYLNREEWDKALVNAQASVKLNSNYPIGLATLGAIYNQLERYAEAEAVYSRAIELTPTFSEAKNGLAIAQLGLGEYEAVRGFAGEKIESQPESVFGYLLMAKAFHKQFIYNQAENYYKKAVEIEPASVDALNNLGNLYMEWGRLDEARQMFEKVLELDGDLAGVREKLEGM